MKTVKLPLHLASVEVRCSAIIFTMGEIQKFWVDKINPMLVEGKDIDEIEETFFEFTQTAINSLKEARPITLPDIDTSNVICEIPYSSVKNYDPVKLQNKIDIAVRGMSDGREETN